MDKLKQEILGIFNKHLLENEDRRRDYEEQAENVPNDSIHTYLKMKALAYKEKRGMWSKAGNIVINEIDKYKRQNES